MVTGGLEFHVMLRHKAGSGWNRLPWEEWTPLFANFGERLLGLEYLAFL